MSRLLTTTLAALAATTLSAAAFAGSVYNFAFTGVTHNNATDTQTAIDQIKLSVELDNGLAHFTFNNLGPNASSIVQIYFDDNHDLLGNFSSLTQSTGVKFEQGANPGNLPGGNPIAFDADVAAQAKSQGGKQKNGVNPNEWLTLSYLLSPSNLDLIHAMNQGNFRVGVHVQGFQSGGSESIVTDTTITAVPTPSAAAAGLLGLVGLANRRRRA